MQFIRTSNLMLGRWCILPADATILRFKVLPNKLAVGITFHTRQPTLDSRWDVMFCAVDIEPSQSIGVSDTLQLLCVNDTHVLFGTAKGAIHAIPSSR